MGFLKPKMPPVPPPPPIPPDPVVRPSNVVETTRKRLTNKNRKNQKTSIMTSSRGVIEDAPIEYASLLGGTKKKGS
tara:strand:+ start:245 stop:472 length:228 start_codon:yes stop_codon:yes gene_type:complete